MIVEYGLGGGVSVQGDVYSYGILLLELFTGKRPTDDMFSESFGLHSYAKRALPHQVLEIVDPELILDEENQQEKGSKFRIKECCLSILRIGVSCSAEMQKERMDIKDVIIELNSINMNFFSLKERVIDLSRRNMANSG
jgi:serine/threonine protein kinase